MEKSATQHMLLMLRPTNLIAFPQIGFDEIVPQFIISTLKG